MGDGQRAAGVVRPRSAGRSSGWSRRRSSSARARWRRGPGRRASRSAVKISWTLPHLAHEAQVLTVAGDDARRFLPAVLKRVQPEVGEVRCLRVPEDTYDSAHGRAEGSTTSRRSPVFFTAKTPMSRTPSGQRVQRESSRRASTARSLGRLSAGSAAAVQLLLRPGRGADATPPAAAASGRGSDGRRARGRGGGARRRWRWPPRAATAPGAAATREAAPRRAAAPWRRWRAVRRRGAIRAGRHAVDVAHVEAAAVGGAGLDHHARGGHVADHAGLVGQAHALGGGDVADHDAGDQDDPGLDVGLDDGARPRSSASRSSATRPSMRPWTRTSSSPRISPETRVSGPMTVCLSSHGAT